MARIGLVTLVVRTYDEAIAWFSETLRFVVHEDTPLSPRKRWVVVGPADSTSARMLLAEAGTRAQQLRVGDQTGGRVAFFLETTDFEGDYARMRERGVEFLEAPRRESYGVVAVFKDLYGNRWDLIEHRSSDLP
jgi:catechol 2,3-dioxygenase-like lactoylglutathione lyase family enzyme